jgi:hypothetical protein
MLGKDKKSANLRFFLSRSALSLFFALFFFALSHFFLASRSRARKREKSASAQLWKQCTLNT